MTLRPCKPVLESASTTLSNHYEKLILHRIAYLTRSATRCGIASLGHSHGGHSGRTNLCWQQLSAQSKHRRKAHVALIPSNGAQIACGAYIYRQYSHATGPKLRLQLSRRRTQCRAQARLGSHAGSQNGRWCYHPNGYRDLRHHGNDQHV